MFVEILEVFVDIFLVFVAPSPDTSRISAALIAPVAVMLLALVVMFDVLVEIFDVFVEMFEVFVEMFEVFVEMFEVFVEILLVFVAATPETSKISAALISPVAVILVEFVAILDVLVVIVL